MQALEDGLMGLEDFRHLVADLKLKLNDVQVQRLFEHLRVDVALATTEPEAPKINVEEFLAGVRRHRFLRRIVNHYSFCDPSAWPVPVKYDYLSPTHVNYGAPVDAGYVGKLVAIRRRLDAGWHGNYAPSRQLWQDAVAHAVALADENAAPSTNPWLVFTCGAMGAGKGWVMNWMSAQEILPLRRIVHVDADRFKQMMPEWTGYVRRDKKSAGTMCHRESGLLAELAQELAMGQRQNVWVDGSLRDFEWHAKKIRETRARHPHYRVALFYVRASEKTIRHRVKTRAARLGGRDVPEDVLADSIAAPAHALSALTPMVDFVARILNETEPVLEAFETVDTTGDWTKIAKMFGGGDEPAPALSRAASSTSHESFFRKRNDADRPDASASSPATRPRHRATAGGGTLLLLDEPPPSPRRELNALRDQRRRDAETIARLENRLRELLRARRDDDDDDDDDEIRGV
ncbi:hypothetical protein CTAYLR_007034, partial [Chrysophaeum taylorii]